MSTPSLSSASAYATGSDLVALYAWDQVAPLLYTKGGAPAPTTEGGTAADSRLGVFLLLASGEVEVACARGGLYMPDQLAALAGGSLGVLKWLVCTLCVRKLVLRANPSVRAEELGAYEDAERMLAELRAGESVFPTGGQLAASTQSAVPISNPNRVWSEQRVFWSPYTSPDRYLDPRDRSRP